MHERVGEAHMALNGVSCAAVLLGGALMLLPLVAGQGECPLLQIEELGRLDAPSSDGLIPPTYAFGDNPTTPVVQVLDFHIVCMSTSAARGRYRYLSVIANYTCGNSPRCEANRVIAQFDMSCIVGQDGPRWEMNVLDGFATGVEVRQFPADGNFSTVPRSDCQACLSQEIAASIQGLGIVPDRSTHCAVCPPSCVGLNLCLFQDTCCNYWSFGDMCVQECPPGLQAPNDNFECSVVAGFTDVTQTFGEEEGVAAVAFGVSDDSVTIANALSVVGGPGLQPPSVSISGSDVNQTLSIPLTANVTFDLIDDSIALEDDEMYVLLVTSLHPRVLIGDPVGGVTYRMRLLVVIADDDILELNFAEASSTVSEGDGDITIQVLQSSAVLQPFSFLIVGGSPDQELVLRSGPENVSESITVTGGSGGLIASLTLPITNDNLALENTEVFSLSITSPSDSRVQLGSVSVTSINIEDDDDALVGFGLRVYNFMENDDSAEVTVEVSNPVIQSFSVRVSGGPLPQPFVELSGPQVDEDVSFPASNMPSSVVIPLSFTDDEVALEALEVFNLTLSSPSDARVVLGGSIGFIDFPVQTEIAIADDDSVVVGFQETTHEFSEGDGTVTVQVERLSAIAQPFSISVAGGPEAQDSVVLSGPQVSETLEFTPGSLLPLVPIQLVISQDDVALEENEVFTLTLSSPSDPRVVVGGTSGGVTRSDQTEVTIVDDDAVVVGFQQTTHEFSEGDGTVTVQVERLSAIAQPFSISVAGGPEAQDSVVLSGPQVSETLEFTPGSLLPLVPIQLVISQDGVALEENEVFTLTLSSPSDPRVVVGGTSGGVTRSDETEVTIVDDDVVIVGFQSGSYDILESAGPALVRILRSNVLAQSLVLRVTGGPGVQPPSVVVSGPDVDTQVVFIGGGGLPPFIDINLVIQDDLVPGEDVESFDLILTQPSDPRVQIGGSVGTVQLFNPARINIMDDDVPTPTPSPSPTPTPEPLVQCRVSSLSEIETFTGSTSYTFNQSCEHVLLTSCDDLGFNFSVRIDFLNADIAQGLVGIRYDAITAVINELGEISTQGGPASEYTVSSTDSRTSFTLNTLGVTVEWEQAMPSAPPTITVYADVTQGGIAGATICGLCGDASGQPVLRDLSPVDLSDAEEREGFFDDFFVNPGETILREGERPECGILDDDQVIGDPLFTVPVYGMQARLLCYEIHGEAGRHFNFISDECVSVNAHYAERIVGSLALNVMDMIAVQAVDNSGRCVNISVSIGTNGECRAVVNGQPKLRYRRRGVGVRSMGKNIVLVTVPNCLDTNLEMTVTCESVGGERMIRFMVTRGLNLREESHGLIGQFWNVPISVTKFDGDTRDGSTNAYIFTVTSPSGAQRTFPAWLENQRWDGSKEPCFYAGSRQGGKVSEVTVAHDSVIEGRYSDYTVGGPFQTEYMYSHFDESRCNT